MDSLPLGGGLNSITKDLGIECGLVDKAGKQGLGSPHEIYSFPLIELQGHSKVGRFWGRHRFSRSKLVDDVDRGCDVSWDKVQGVGRESGDKKRGRAERSESSEYQDGVEFHFFKIW